MKESDLERILKAMANKRRLNILSFIKKKKTATVGEISWAIKLSFRSTSKHLVILMVAGILDKEQKGLSVFYYFAKDCPSIASQVISTLK